MKKYISKGKKNQIKQTKQHNVLPRVADSRISQTSQHTLLKLTDHGPSRTTLALCFFVCVGKILIYANWDKHDNYIFPALAVVIVFFSLYVCVLALLHVSFSCCIYIQ